MDRHLLLKDEAGFTLFELLTVITIIAALAAIALPTFLGNADRAHAAVDRSDARTSLIEQRVQDIP